MPNFLPPLVWFPRLIAGAFLLTLAGCAQIDKILTPDDRERVLEAVEDARADLEATLGTVEDQARDELRRLAVERLVAP